MASLSDDKQRYKLVGGSMSDRYKEINWIPHCYEKKWPNDPYIYDYAEIEDKDFKDGGIYHNSLIIFNDNCDHYKTDNRGSNNGAIRKHQNDFPNNIAGMVTGKPSLEEGGFNELNTVISNIQNKELKKELRNRNPTVQNIIDVSFENIDNILRQNRQIKNVFYSIDKSPCELGFGIYNPSNEVKKYINNLLRERIHCYVDSEISSSIENLVEFEENDKYKFYGVSSLYYYPKLRKVPLSQLC